MKQLPVLQIGQFDMRAGSSEFYANQFIPHLEKHHSKINHPHKHDFYLVVLFTKGSGLHEIDFTKFEIQPGSVFFMTPGQMHNWELSDDIDGWIFFHNASIFNEQFQSIKVQQFPFYNSLQNTPFLQLDTSMIPEIESMFQQLFHEFNSQQYFQKSFLISLVHLLYIKLSRQYFQNGIPKSESGSKDTIRMYELEQLIDIHFVLEKSPDFYAEKLNISTKHLNRLVRSTLNCTTNQFIHQRIIVEAKRLLVTNQFSISEVCFQIGMDDPSYFSRFFKKQTGLSPTEFISSYNPSSSIR